MKHCSICDRDLTEDRFHKRAASADGLAARCKDCQRVYDYGRLHLPHRVALRTAYRMTEDGKRRVKIGSKKWAMHNPAKRVAHILVGNAIRDGRLIKQPCEVCGGEIVDAHHDDYTKPLTVRWFCKQHHVEHHVSLRRKTMFAHLESEQP